MGRLRAFAESVEQGLGVLDLSDCSTGAVELPGAILALQHSRLLPELRFLDASRNVFSEFPRSRIA
jgi:hypothetical protein